ncbi:hypothetical protein PLICRDRAFT_54603 [Plicaturopsis crispa FD-325 SS-3]|nr:hypothetical protein PLICRDRAFT_54603 [Plicaturopsis crispa FD-325 SS-3]
MSTLAAALNPTPTEPAASTSNLVTLRKCARCTYKGPEETFPLKKNGSGYLRACGPCNDKWRALHNKRPRQEEDAADTHGDEPSAEPQRKKVKAKGPRPTPPTVTLAESLRTVEENKDNVFDLDMFVDVPLSTWDGTETTHARANKLREMYSTASDYRWNQKKTRNAGTSSVITYYCAQIEGEQTRHPRTGNGTRSVAKMCRYKCAGWMHITIMHNRELLVRVRIAHAEAHPHYVDKPKETAIAGAEPRARRAPAAGARQTDEPAWNDGWQDGHEGQWEHEEEAEGGIPGPHSQPSHVVPPFPGARLYDVRRNLEAILAAASSPNGVDAGHAASMEGLFTQIEKVSEGLYKDQPTVDRHRNRYA